MRCVNSWRKHSPPKTFLFASGNFLHSILPGRYGEVQSTILSLFEHLDYGNDICLLCYRVIDLHQIALDVEKASNVGQEITKVVRFADHHPLPICRNEQNIDGAKLFISR